jgi:DNA invertase Pin-like site-specific DNA recombinase
LIADIRTNHWRIRAALWAIGRSENGGRIATRQPNEVLIKVPVRLFERVGFHRTAHALSAPLKGARGALRAVEDFGSDPSRVPARMLSSQSASENSIDSTFRQVRRLLSTDKQGQSGLGLDAQRQAVMTYLNGGPWKLIAEYTEVETGKRADRPELQKALAACRKHKAKLAIAKLDRPSRNLAFIATLMDSNVEYIAADNPHANRLTVHILAAVAEHERAAISERTKAALQAAKRRGVKLGGPRLGAARKASIKVRSEAGVSSLRAVARALTVRGIACQLKKSCAKLSTCRPRAKSNP